MTKVTVLTELTPEMVVEKLTAREVIVLHFLSPETKKYVSIKAEVISGGLGIDGKTYFYTLLVQEGTPEVAKGHASLKMFFLAPNIGYLGYLSTLEY